MNGFKSGSVIADIFIELISNATSANAVSTNVRSSSFLVKLEIRVRVYGANQKTHEYDDKAMEFS